MHNRIDEKFEELKKCAKTAFIPYITAGDPSLARTYELVLALERAGADMIELGIPFSDPLADGKTNQEAAERALLNDVSLFQVIELVAKLRLVTQIPIVFFTYLNPVFQLGFENFAKLAAKAGVDGVLVLDQPPEEAAECKAALDHAALKTIFLIAPTSSNQRIKMIADQASGFIYYVSRTGVTGARSEMSLDLAQQIENIRKFTKLPIAVGFGISTPQHVAKISRLADGVIVGSAIVSRVGQGGDSDQMVADIETFVGQLTSPLRSHEE